MSLITYENLEDGTPVTANIFNERFGDIIREINGNLTAANLADGAVSTPKLQDEAVTFDKIDSAVYRFSAYMSANQNITTNPETIKFNVTDYDIGDCFNTADNTFTAPVNGVYDFTAYLQLNQFAGALYIRIQVNGVNVKEVAQSQSGNGNGGGVGTFTLPLLTNDVVKITAYVNHDSQTSVGGTLYNGFTGKLVYRTS